MLPLHLFSQDSGYFLFLQARLRENIQEVKAAFEGENLPLHLAYSIKANNFEGVLQTCAAAGLSLECASLDEVKRAQGFGARVHVNTPWLNTALATYCVENEILVYAENREQVLLLEKLARDTGRLIKAGIRLHVLPRQTSRFGFELTQENIDWLRGVFTSNPYIQLHSLHCHYSGPDRSAKHLGQRCRGLKEAYEMLESTGHICSLNIGGGMAGHIGQKQLQEWDFELPTWSEYAAAVQSGLGETLKEKGLQLFMEPGAALVADAFVFVAEVVAVKETGGHHTAVLNTNNTVLRPTRHQKTLGFEVIRNGKRIPPEETNERTTVAGNTCMENDLVCVWQGVLKTGDKLAFSHMGAYTISFAGDFIFNRPEIRIFEG